MRILLLLYVLSSISVAELPGSRVWNRLDQVRSGIKTSSSLSSLERVGAIVSSGLSVASEISIQVSTAKGLKDTNEDLLVKSRAIHSRGVSALVNPSKKQDYLNAFNAIRNQERLQDVQLKTENLLGVARQAYLLIGDLLSMQSMSEEAAALDEDLFLLTKLGNRISQAISRVNNNLDAIDQLELQPESDEISMSVIQQSIQINEKLGRALDELQDVLSDGIEEAEEKVFSFANDMQSEIGALDSDIHAISRDIHEGISKLLLGQIEADTKTARECYRKLMEKFLDPAPSTEKSTLQILLANTNLLTVAEQAKNTQLKASLNHIEHGVKACVNEFRAVFDPAQGTPSRPRGLFAKIRDKFEFEYPSPASWNEQKAFLELQTFQPMLQRVLVQFTNLFIFETALEATETGHMKRSIDRFLDNSQKVITNFNHNFPPCEITHSMEAAMQSKLLYCNKPLLLVKDPTEIELNRKYGIPLGTQCSFECYNLLEDPLPNITCGPLGKFSRNDSEITTDFLRCRNALNCLGDSVTRRMRRDLEAMSEKISSIDKTVEKKITNLTNSHTLISRDIDSITERLNCAEECSCGCRTRTIVDLNSQQILNSPNYPRKYCNYTECNWDLIVPSNRSIKIDFASFHTETNYDTLTIHDTAGSLLRNCSGTTCNSLRSSGNRLKLRFKSDGSNEYSGFSVVFSAV